MTLNEIQERNYAAQIKRGKITVETTVADCIDDLAGEVLELYEESPGTPEWLMEAADVILNTLSACKKAGFNGSNVLLACQQKMEYNEKRND